MTESEWVEDGTAALHDAFRDAPADLATRYLRFRERYPTRALKVGDARWEYVSGGRGDECLLLLAGGARFADSWFGLVGELEEEFRIVATTDPGVRSMAGLLEGTLAVLDAEGIRRAHVVGTSFGGLVAQCLVREHPDRVRSMILSNTLLPSTLPAWLLSVALKVARVYPTWLLQQSVRWNTLLLMSARGDDRAFWKAFWKHESRTRLRRMSRAQALSQYEVLLDAAARYRFTPADLDSWSGNVYLIESADDIGYIRRAQPALRALYPSAPVHRFTDAGHTPGYGRPAAYADVLRSFLLA